MTFRPLKNLASLTVELYWLYWFCQDLREGFVGQCQRHFMTTKKRKELDVCLLLLLWRVAFPVRRIIKVPGSCITNCNVRAAFSTHLNWFLSNTISAGQDGSPVGVLGPKVRVLTKRYPDTSNSKFLFRRLRRVVKLSLSKEVLNRIHCVPPMPSNSTVNFPQEVFISSWFSNFSE